MTRKKDKGLNPYFAGAATGILAVISVLLTGKFFGASTTFVRAAGMIEKFFAPARVFATEYFIKEKPVIDWQWMFVAGIFFGALIASLMFKEFSLKTIPDMWETQFGRSHLKRAIVAFIGGVIAMLGARLADGCPSGHGLSGLMQLALSGFIALFFFFVGGVFITSFLYRGGE